MGQPDVPGESSEDGSTQQFVAEVTQTGVDDIVDHALSEAMLRLRKHPDQIMWGTDRARSWQFDEQATDLIVQVSRRFIGQLPRDLQEAYAFRNALRAFSEFLP